MLKNFFKPTQLLSTSPATKLTSLLKDDNAQKNQFWVDIEKITKNCLICTPFAKTPPRPVVNFPLAQNFNEKVAMDLKSLSNKWILIWMICGLDWPCQCSLIQKIPKSAIYATVFNWVGAGYGVMKSDLKDKGGEFCVDEIGEVSSILII